MTSNTKDFTPAAHKIWQKGNVPSIYTHAVAFHGILNFFGNGRPVEIKEKDKNQLKFG